MPLQTRQRFFHTLISICYSYKTHETTLYFHGNQIKEIKQLLYVILHLNRRSTQKPLHL